MIVYSQKSLVDFDNSKFNKTVHTFSEYTKYKM